MDQISDNITEFGYHITVVIQELVPRYAYSIGLSEIIGCELVFPGGIFFHRDDVRAIFEEGKRVMEGKESHGLRKPWTGNILLAGVHPSWSKKMMLGAFDYYNTDFIKSRQIIVDSVYSLDVPNMYNELKEETSGCWKYLNTNWTYKIPSNSSAAIDIDFLKGDTITEVMRWENDYWEMFTRDGSNIEKSHSRIVPMSLLLESDKSLEKVLTISIGKGVWRESKEDHWKNWG